ncbi:MULTISPECIES: TIR domain-containing protein [Pseudomonas syringae group]|uniref:TIR domain-containing protein n=1 Tax=Pseudomonas syringae group TaxID=136849 RepID=UPI0009B29B6B|nr:MULTISPECIES: TIR domain-containing protein [Pseudomonas syringae group]
MSTSEQRRHLFISHHHRDDAGVDRLTSLLGSKGWDVRNSSIRAKPANQARLDQGLVSESVIRRILRIKIAWASTVVVLIGKETHTRPWVNWEIDQAHAQGKRIVGVYEQGGKDSDIPKSLEKYASAIVGWNSSSIKKSIDCEENTFENPDGSDRSSVNSAANSEC